MDLKLRINTKKNVERSLLELDDEVVQPVSPTSEYFLTEVVTLYVLCFLELDIPVDYSFAFAFLNDVFINVHPRLSSIVIENKRGRKMWKKVEVNVEDHIKIPSFPEELSAEEFSEHLDNYVSKIATSKLPPNKPLWELHVINCPKGHTSPGTAILKIHHAIGDGTSLMGIVFSCFRRVYDPSLPLTFPSKTYQTTSKNEDSVANIMIKIFKMVPNFISSIIYSFHDFGQGLRMLFSEDTKTPIRSGVTDMTRPFSTRVCSVTLSLNDVKKIKTLVGVTVNDIIVGIIFLGTRLYIKEVDGSGQQENTRSTASIFVNIRSMKGNVKSEDLRKAKTFGNRITNIELPLPNLRVEDLENPLKFIEKAHKIIKNKRLGIYGPFLMIGLLDTIRAFAGIQTAAKTFERRWKNSSFAITNLIGPTEKISIANHPVKGFYFVPTGIDLSLTVSVLSYMDELRIGLVLENGFIDHKRLITCVEKAFHLIFQAAQSKATSCSNDA